MTQNYQQAKQRAQQASDRAWAAARDHFAEIKKVTNGSPADPNLVRAVFNMVVAELLQREAAIIHSEEDQ